MDWISNVIDALSRFYDKTGFVGSFLFLVVGGMMAMLIIVVYRHSGSIVKAVELIASTRAEEAGTREKMAKDIADQSLILATISSHAAQIAEATAATKKKISEWPSDPKKDLCKADDAKKQSEANAKLLEEMDRKHAERIEQIKQIVLAARASQ